VLSARNAPRVNVNSINFAVHRGVVVPPRVNVVSVTVFPSLIEVFPQYRDYSFFVVEDEIVFLDRERRVVDVVPAGPRTRFSRAGRGGGGSVAALDLSEEEIREVQLVLIERGFLIGEADGVFSPRTRQALIAFQRQRGIATTGSIDTRTVASLGLSNRIGQQQTRQQTRRSTTEGQSSTVGRGQTGIGQGQTGRSQRQQDQSTTGQATGRPQGQQPSAQQRPAQQNTTGQAAPQNRSQDQSTVGRGRGGSQPGANQNMRSGQGSGAAPSTTGQGNPPAQNPGQNPANR
jgi:peptidoglycan hydrolase-like protein with peptidoglycan-binding domain